MTKNQKIKQLLSDNKKMREWLIEKDELIKRIEFKLDCEIGNNDRLKNHYEGIISKQSEEISKLHLKLIFAKDGLTVDNSGPIDFIFISEDDLVEEKPIKEEKVYKTWAEWRKLDAKKENVSYRLKHKYKDYSDQIDVFIEEGIITKDLGVETYVQRRKESINFLRKTGVLDVWFDAISEDKICPKCNGKKYIEVKLPLGATKFEPCQYCRTI